MPIIRNAFLRCTVVNYSFEMPSNNEGNKLKVLTMYIHTYISKYRAITKPTDILLPIPVIRTATAL
jgi:hypothetical protein